MIYIVGIIVVSLVVLSLVVSSRGASYTVAKTVEHDPSLPRIVLDGVLLHGETLGNSENPAVIAVHGGPGWDYRSLLPLKALSDEYFVVLYDQCGTGLSPRVDDDELSVDSYLAELDALVNRYGRGRPVNLIGHSFGGMLVSRYVGWHPNKVAGVVLAEPGPLTKKMTKHDSYQFHVGAGFILNFVGSWLESWAYSGPDGHARDDYFQGKYLAAYGGTGHPMARYTCDGKVPPEGLEHWRLGRRAWVAVRKTYPLSEEDQEFSFVEGVEAVDKEVLFVAGRCDEVLGQEFQREQMKYFPKARIVVIDDAGHEMFANNPKASLAPVRTYLREQNGQAF